MTDFVIVVATIVALGSPASDAAPKQVPLNAPTVGFRTYADLEACAQAIGTMTTPKGSRLVCLPVESQGTDLPAHW